MRRFSPATLLRPVQQALRPTSAACRRFESSSSSSNSANGSSDPSTSTASSSTSETSPSPIQVPAEQPKSTPSMYRTQPLKVKWRRANTLLPHPHFARDIFDPELFDLERETVKRMPGNEEREFETWRDRGFFPGEKIVARTHYLEFERLWQARIRGFEFKWFNRQTGTWDTRNKLGFFMKLHEERGFGLPQNDIGRDLSMYELFKSRPKLFSIVNNLKADQVKKHLDLDLNTVEFAFNGDDWFSRVKTAEGQPEAAWIALEGKELEEFNAAVEHIVDWDSLAATVKEEDRKPYREELVAYRVYLPNVAIRLVRNFTLKTEEYDPYIATFRIPTMMTKHDLRSYLKAVYNLDVTFIRTDVYWGRIKRNSAGQKARLKGSRYNYKRAVVGLYQPFHYPDDLDELRALSRATGRGDELYMKRMDALESTYFIKANALFRKKLVQKILKRATYRYRDAGQGNRGSIVRNILVKKQERENVIRGVAQEMRRRVDSQ